MFRLLLFSFLLLIVLPGYTQNAFQSGYYVNTDGDTIQGYIRNVDWSKNPENIRFKSALEVDPVTVEKDDIQSFSVDYLKFVRATIAVDETPNNLRTRATRRNPDWIIKTVFLKVLVKGKKDLLLYDDNKLRKFYYTDSYDTITPLVYRKYSTDAATISENNMYQQQLFNYVNCNVTTDDVLKVNYNLESLEDYFVTYNKCEGEQPTIFTEVKRKNVMHLTPKINGGLVSGEILLLSSTSSSYRSEVANEPQFGFGLELEYVFSFERNRFSLIFQPGYQQFSFEEIDSPDSLTFDSKFLTLGLGGRYSVYKGQNSRWFVNAAYVHYVSMGAGFTYRNEEFISRPERTEFDLKSGPGIHIGTGFILENRLFIQARYDLRFELNNPNLIQNPSFGAISLELGFLLF